MTDLLKEIRKKDRKGIAALYNSYGKKLYGFAVCKWHVSEDEAWELVYKTLYKIMNVIDRYTFDNESKFNSFVFQVFINNLRNHYQEKKSRHIDMVSLEEKHENRASEKKEDAAEQAPDSVHMACLKQILESFEDWKRVLLLMKAQDFSYDDIARYVQKPSGQLKVYYMRAKQVLTDKVNDCVKTARA